MGYKRGVRSGPDQPDWMTPEGYPVDLKPDTPRGLREGKTQVSRYVRNLDPTNPRRGEIWGWTRNGDGTITLTKRFDTGNVYKGRVQWKPTTRASSITVTPVSSRLVRPNGGPNVAF